MGHWTRKATLSGIEISGNKNQKFSSGTNILCSTQQGGSAEANFSARRPPPPAPGLHDPPSPRNPSSIFNEAREEYTPHQMIGSTLFFSISSRTFSFYVFGGLGLGLELGLGLNTTSLHHSSECGCRVLSPVFISFAH